MKKTLILLSCILLSGCGISQEDYDNLQNDYSTLEEKYNTLSADYEKLKAEHDELNEQYDTLSTSATRLEVIDNKEEPPAIPEGYRQVSLQIGDNDDLVPAWTNDKYYIVFGYEGYGWFLYDPSDSTHQPYEQTQAYKDAKGE